jgi:hypothetical protein
MKIKNEKVIGLQSPSWIIIIISSLNLNYPKCHQLGWKLGCSEKTKTIYFNQARVDYNVIGHV